MSRGDPALANQSHSPPRGPSLSKKHKASGWTFRIRRGDAANFSGGLSKLDGGEAESKTADAGVVGAQGSREGRWSPGTEIGRGRVDCVIGLPKPFVFAGVLPHPKRGPHWVSVDAAGSGTRSGRPEHFRRRRHAPFRRDCQSGVGCREVRRPGRKGHGPTQARQEGVARTSGEGGVPE